jgi:peroxiredoxin
MKFFLAFIFAFSTVVSAFALESEKPAAKNFSLPALDGKIIDLQEQRGKVVVLTFWSTICPICHSELPKMSRLVDKNAGREVVFLALTMENESRVGAYLNRRPFKSVVIPNSLGVLMDYSSKDQNGNFNMGFPSYFVINQSGEIEMSASGRNKIGAVDDQINHLLQGRW